MQSVHAQYFSRIHAACPLGFEEWLEDCVDALIGPLMAAQALLDVSNIVIDGDLGSDIMERLTERLRAAMIENLPEACVAPTLKLGTFGSNAHSLGAASLPLFIDFAPRAAVEANARPLKGGHDTRAA